MEENLKTNMKVYNDQVNKLATILRMNPLDIFRKDDQDPKKAGTFRPVNSVHKIQFVGLAQGTFPLYSEIPKEELEDMNEMVSRGNVGYSDLMKAYVHDLDKPLMVTSYHPDNRVAEQRHHVIQEVRHIKLKDQKDNATKTRIEIYPTGLNTSQRHTVIQKRDDFDGVTNFETYGLHVPNGRLERVFFDVHFPYNGEIEDEWAKDVDSSLTKLFLVV